MEALRARLNSSPLLARTVPFLVFLLLTLVQGHIGSAGQFWMYFAKTLVGLWLLALTWKAVPEMRWEITPRAILVGVLVCVLWVALDPYYPKMGSSSGPNWNPFAEFGSGSALAWFFFAARLLGSSLVVPPLEEVFYRSFLYRYVVNQDFLKIPLAGINWAPFLAVSAVFGLAHGQWLGGIFCGMIYQWLVCRTGRLGEAMVAHGVTNFLLAVWIVWKGAWQFW